MGEETPVNRLVVSATSNPHKLREITAIVGAYLTVLPRPDEVSEVLEDGDTLAANARLKAVALMNATGMPALADDTGLEVDALDGRPGVHSARYGIDLQDPERVPSDEGNRKKLLDEMQHVPVGQRGAQFRTVALLLYPDGTEVLAEGIVRGTITTRPAGDYGFGYDPIFVPVEADGRTFGEMSDETKNMISHRGRAFRALIDQLEN